MGGKILLQFSPFVVFLLLVVVVQNVFSHELRSQKIATRTNGNKEDYDAILSNVNGVGIDGLPGFLCVYGSTAIPLLAGETGQPNIYHPIGAANNLGLGKIIGFTHDGFLSPESSPISDKNQLILNSVNWTSKVNQLEEIQVAVVSYENDTLINFLISQDISTSQITLDELQSLSDIANYHVVFIKEFFDESKVPILKEYVENGGGLVIGLTSWAHSYFLDINGNFGSNFPANMISAPAGFIWRNEDGDCYAYPTSTDQTQFNSSSEYVKKVHVLDAWETIQEFLFTGEISEELDQNKLQYSSILEPALEFIPPEFSFVSQEIYEYIRNYTRNLDRQPIPTEKNPVVNDTEKFDLQLFYAFNFVLQPQHVPVHPGSALFPGEVVGNSSSSYNQNTVEEHNVQITLQKPDWPVKNIKTDQTDDNDNEIQQNFIFEKINIDIYQTFKSSPNPNPRAFLTNSMNTCEETDLRHKINEEDSVANFKQKQLKSKLETEKKRILSHRNGKEGEEEEEDLDVSTQLPQWFSTGLYAPAGQVINISVVESSEILSKYQVLIGSHTDDISRHEKWFRSPRIVKKFPLENNQAVLASPYGGIIYIVIPQSELLKLNDTETIRLRISGAVKYPLFRLGETSVKEWRENIRYSAGPWAEFESENLVLTVRSGTASKVHDPEDLILFWDQVMDAIADLSQIPRKRVKQERMVGDIQISAGFMHSGYPIMTFLAESDLSIDIETLRREGSWGHFHELGHNHQNGAWTFGGTGEVTCNLFALYVLNTVCGISTPNTRPEMSPEKYKVEVADYILNGVNFQEWKSKPFLALLTYVQLQRSYGWGAFKTVFNYYNNLSPEEQPITDEEKIDLWVITFSSVVHENLTPFFTSWGIPVSEEASNQINQFPEASLRIFDLLND